MGELSSIIAKIIYTAFCHKLVMKRKKGISAFLASVLMISIVFVVGLVVTTWMTNVTRTTQIQAENKTTEATQCASASITIDDVYVNSTGGRVIVRNSGQSDNLQIVSAVMINVNGSTVTNSSTLDADFDKGEILTINFAGGTFGCPSGFSKAIVSTNCGGISAEFTTAPKCF